MGVVEFGNISFMLKYFIKQFYSLRQTCLIAAFFVKACQFKMGIIWSCQLYLYNVY